MKITVLTLFPEWFAGPLGGSIIGRARAEGLLDIELVQIRDFSTDRHRSVDDDPYGGGGGMVMRADVLARALDDRLGPPGRAGRAHAIYTSPRGRPFTQQDALRLARLPAVAFLCGHYEGVDERLLQTRIDETISLGDFVLTGGEIPVMAMVDAIARMIPGVLGNDSSAQNDSFMNGLLEAPHFTRPPEFEGRPVPGVLLSGNHAQVAAWREGEALRLTREHRPDLLALQVLSPPQVRRLARRARPFAIWETAPPGGEPRFLFVAGAIRSLEGWQEQLLGLRHPERSEISGRIRFAEVSAARSGDDAADRTRLLEDLRASTSIPVLARNLIREMEAGTGAAGGSS